MLPPWCVGDRCRQTFSSVEMAFKSDGPVFVRFPCHFFIPKSMLFSNLLISTLPRECAESGVRLPPLPALSRTVGSGEYCAVPKRGALDRPRPVRVYQAKNNQLPHTGSQGSLLASKRYGQSAAVRSQGRTEVIGHTWNGYIKRHLS